MTYEQQIAKSRERFDREVAEHQMTVLRDDDLYRHLRCQRPGTWSYGFDIVTWPGYLAVVGDCGDFVFSRTRDMFEFFESDHGINPHYWSEKLQAPRSDAAERYSEEAFRARVAEWFQSEAEWLGEDEAASLRAALDDQILIDDWGRLHDEHEARRVLDEFQHEGRRIESWEWTFREYDWQFLWCCHAIVWGIAQYRKASQAVAA